MNRKPLYIVMSTVLTAAMAMPVYAGEYDERAAEDADRSSGQVVDDLSIAARLKAELAADGTTDAHKIDIEVDRDSVQLNGWVDTEAERERAEEIAMGIDGVTNVQNNLELQSSDRTAGEYIDDKMLIAKVKTALADDPTVEALTIDVESERGVVSLGGHVDTAKERDAAEKAAARVAGIVDVVNNIEVRS